MGKAPQEISSKPSIKTVPVREAQAYRIEELAAFGPLGKTSLYQAIKEKRLRARKAGGCTIVLARDWLAFLEALPDARAA